LWQNKLTKPKHPSITGIENGLIPDCKSPGFQMSSINPYRGSTEYIGGIKSLRRPISPEHSSYLSNKKRFSYYPTTQSIEKVL